MSLTIRPLQADAEREACARLMASSEPWLTLGRTYEASLALIEQPGKEVYVAPECRGQGIGSRLVEWAEARIFRDSPNVFMCVSSFNDGAFRLYQRLGYQVVGELTDFLVRGASEILLRKTRGTWAEFADRRGGT